MKQSAFTAIFASLFILLFTSGAIAPTETHYTETNCTDVVDIRSSITADVTTSSGNVSVLLETNKTNFDIRLFKGDFIKFKKLKKTDENYLTPKNNSGNSYRFVYNGQNNASKYLYNSFYINIKNQSGFQHPTITNESPHVGYRWILTGNYSTYSVQNGCQTIKFLKPEDVTDNSAPTLSKSLKQISNFGEDFPMGYRPNTVTGIAVEDLNGLKGTALKNQFLFEKRDGINDIFNSVHIHEYVHTTQKNPEKHWYYEGMADYYAEKHLNPHYELQNFLNNNAASIRLSERDNISNIEDDKPYATGVLVFNTLDNKLNDTELKTVSYQVRKNNLTINSTDQFFKNVSEITGENIDSIQHPRDKNIPLSMGGFYFAVYEYSWFILIIELIGLSIILAGIIKNLIINYKSDE